MDVFLNCPQSEICRKMLINTEMANILLKLKYSMVCCEGTKYGFVRDGVFGHPLAMRCGKFSSFVWH